VNFLSNHLITAITARAVRIYFSHGGTKADLMYHCWQLSEIKGFRDLSVLIIAPECKQASSQANCGKLLKYKLLKYSSLFFSMDRIIYIYIYTTSGR